jgi:hypothetical protein
MLYRTPLPARVFWSTVAALALAGPACTCNRGTPGGAAGSHQVQEPPSPGRKTSPAIRPSIGDRHQPGPGELRRVERLQLTGGRVRLGPSPALRQDSDLDQVLKHPGVVVPGRVRLSGELDPCGTIHLLQAQDTALLVKLPLSDEHTYAGPATVEGRLTRDHRMLQRLRAECDGAAASPGVLVSDSAIVKVKGE